MSHDVFHIGQSIQVNAQLSCSPSQPLSQVSTGETVFALFELLRDAFAPNEIMHLQQQTAGLWS